MIGFDGQETAIDALQNDLITASVRQYPSEMGVLGVQLAIQLIQGEEIEFDDPETKTLYSPLDMLDKSVLEAEAAETADSAETAAPVEE